MKIRRIFALLIVSLLANNVYAEGRLYKIELVIFSQNMPNTEVFDQTESRIDWPNRLVDRSAYRSVSPQSMRLHGSNAQIRRSQNYRPLMHIGWIQRVGANRISNAVKISNSEGTINGFFRIQRGNLLHMIADIEYSPGSVIYRLNEKRRFKLNQTHYLDHPKFGILVRISSLK
jgi:hypothetical protein